MVWRDEDKTIAKFFDDVCGKNQQKTALFFEDDRFTYADLYRNVMNIAKNLLKAGIGKESKVAIILPNCKEYIFLYFALFKIGAIAVPCNTKWESSELASILINADVDTVIYKQVIGVINFYKCLNAIETEYGKCLKRYEIDEEHSAESNRFSQLLETAEGTDMPEIFPDDIAMISYTSGTTGNPKGVVMQNRCLYDVSRSSAELFKKGDTPLSIAPLYAAQGFLSLLIQFFIEGYMTYLSTFNPNDILKRVSRRQNNIIHTQPTMWNLMLQNRLIEFTDFSAVEKVVVSGSLCAPELARKIEEKVGCNLINIYGLIEATSTVTSTRYEDSDEIRYNTIGRPIEGVEIKIVDDDRKEVPKGETGELAVKGYVMKGYFRNKKSTDEVIEEEWLYTGDLARYYDGENIEIVGRKKDMIIRGGFNIYPSDVENCIMEHPQVMDVSVVGKQHAVLGESIIAFIVTKPGVELTEGDIYKYCKGKLSNYKIPDEICFIHQMPVILAGKIDKKVLRNWVESGEYKKGGIS